MSKLSSIFLVVGVLCGDVSGGEVAVVYVAELKSIGGPAFAGFGLVEGMEATGVVRYDFGSSDVNPSETSGWYFQNRLRAFEMRVGGVEILGSEKVQVQVQVENFPGTDTFRVVDGHLFETDRAMWLNGARSNSLRWVLAITDTTGQVFEDDGLPEVFPLAADGSEDYPYSHTFSINDRQSSLVFTLLSLEVVEDPVEVPFEIRSLDVGAAGGLVTLGWATVAGRRYGVEWSGDLVGWERLPGEVWATGGLGEWTGDGRGVEGYFRVVELGE